MRRKSDALDQRALEAASLHLTGFVLAEAARLSETEGFGWTPSESAPTTFEQLLDVYARCKESGERLPVRSSEGSTIFGSPGANHAWLFIEALAHVHLELDFDLDAELAVHIELLQRLRSASYAPGSLEWHLLHAHTIGQLVARCVLERPVNNPKLFVFEAVEFGLRAAVEREMHRTSATP